MKYFGTDGIRGKFNETITKELAYKLGRSLIKLKCNRVVVATDTRESKDILSKYLIDGALFAGMEVINAGVIPTPALVYYSKINNIIGVMITASHNPFYDNGLKVLKSGMKLNLEEELLIESELEIEVKYNSFDDLSIDKSVLDNYIDFLSDHKFYSNINIVVDCANGATYQSAKILSDMCNLTLIANNPNGVNINSFVGSTYLNHLRECMNLSEINLGFALDGDGDRVLAISNGEVIDGDQIIFIIATHLKKKNKLKDNTVVLTQMSNIGILNRLNELDINYILTPVGDKYVVKELSDKGYSIGGENSGHIILNDILSTGDGVLVIMYLLNIIKETNKSLNELLSDVIMYKDRMVNLSVRDKSIINSDTVSNKIIEIENKLDGKVIVRASGTENVVRVSVMAKTIEEVNMYINELVDLIGG